MAREPIKPGMGDIGEHALKTLVEEILEAVKPIEEDLGRENLRQFYDSYLQTTSANVARLKELLAAERGLEFAMAAHALKGSSSMFGLGSVQALCLELEDLGHVSDFASAAVRLQRLEREMPMVYAALEYCRRF
jgi:HPt (histidine-containing phosphotransfer) domain-containing protein